VVSYPFVGPLFEQARQVATERENSEPSQITLWSGRSLLSRLSLRVVGAGPLNGWIRYRIRH
jgi:hypothetical protein